jgi:hypothetical protein
MANSPLGVGGIVYFTTINFRIARMLAIVAMNCTILAV